MAGPTGIEPATYGLRVKFSKNDFNFEDYKAYLENKYSKHHSREQFNNTKKYFECLANPAKMLTFPESKRRKILIAMTCASKYLGVYEQYKVQLKSHGIKWVNNSTAFNAFLAIFNHQHDTVPAYLKEIQPILPDNEKLFVKFLALTGLRKNEALTSFNMILELSAKGRLDEYYNSDLQVLEHFKYKVFLRGTKNAYISFATPDLVTEICNSQPVSYSAVDCRLKRRKVRLRLKELRSYNNTFMRKNGLISELVDILAGRVPQSVFCRHYLGEDIKALSAQVLSIQTKLWEALEG